MHPLVYEINTRCWLWGLSQSAGRPLTLAEIPNEQFEFWRELGFTHVWLMGVWRAGERARAHSLKLAELKQSGLPFADEDVAGSPYAIAEYRVSPSLGGESGLRAFREKLAGYGMRLILDFVPNHLGHDHPWLEQRPDLFVRSRLKRLDTFPCETAKGSRWLAYGKDPYMGAWNDTVQLDYRNPATRQAMLEQLQRVAGLCDGVRCDMAMLVLNDVFAKTWKEFHSTFSPAPVEFWAEAIQEVRAQFPGFLFLAEVYWGLETRLQALGFDFTYDKRLYDHLVAKDAAAVQRHLLSASEEFLARGTHFLENHDEPRVASLLSAPEQQAAALVILGLPGMCLLHEGQLTGARQRLSVHLARRRLEPEQSEIARFYGEVLKQIQQTSVRRGRASLLQPREAWPGNPTASNFVVIQWTLRENEFDLVVVNLAAHPSQCYVDLTGRDRSPVAARTPDTWEMKNILGPERFLRDNADLMRSGLYLDVPAHGAQLFRFVLASSRRTG